MRFARLLHNGQPTYARLAGDHAEGLAGPPWEGVATVSDRWAWRDADLLCPVAPSKIVCIGRNYAAHARELGNDVPAEPLLFLKPPSSLLAPGGVVVLPPESARVEHEAELVVVIGRRAARVSASEASSCVFGYTAAGDITARDLQRKDVQFTRAKGFDTFCPVGPWIETDLQPGALRVRCTVNAELRQDGTTDQMIFDVPTLVAYVSAAMTLEPGDIILTGTPSGVGPLAPGDSLCIDISGIGALRVTVQSSAR
jgi:2-keto-4-pentenoate hydratase/2-oxohepta-3-ene-1,7-dioic acid hydratase in catechol pathway